MTATTPAPATFTLTPALTASPASTPLSRYEELLAQHDYAMLEGFVSVNAPWCIQTPHTQLVPDFLRSDAEKMPIILPLKSANLPRLCKNMLAAEQGEEACVISSLFSVPPESDPKLLELYMRHRLILKHPGGESFLRYYDSRVFPHLIRILTPEQLHGFFKMSTAREASLFTRWTFTFQDEWMSLTPSWTGQWHDVKFVSDAQRRSLDRVELLNILMLNKYWLATGKHWRNLEDFNAAVNRVEQAILTARRLHGLRFEDDMIAFGLHSLLYGEDFDLHPLITRILQNVASEEAGYYESETALLSDADWQAIAAGRINP